MVPLLAVILEAIKVVTPQAIDIYTIIHDRQSGKISLITQMDANAATLQATVSELVVIRAKLAEPLIK